MGRRSNEELKAAGASPRKRGEGTVFEVPGRPGYFRAVRTLEIKGKPVQVSGSGNTQEQAIQRREKNVIKKLGSSPQSAFAQPKVFPDAVALTKKPTPSITLEVPMGDWPEWRKYQV